MSGPLTYLADASRRTFRRAIRALGYDAIDSRNRRKAPDGILRSEDHELTPDQRRKLVSSARDLRRNFALAGWMIRKHLDYVATFNFQSKTGNPTLDKKVEAFVKRWSKAKNCDITKRHRLSKLMRMWEARRALEGDVGVMRLASGYVQSIEGDRIRTPVGGFPDGTPASAVCHGVQSNEAGEPLRYAVCRRGRATDYASTPGNFTFERWVPATNMHLHGYFERFDQTRGVGLITPAMNTLRDTYEGCEYALAKMKVSQLFGLAMYRDAEDAVGEIEDDDEAHKKIDFGKGPIQLDLDITDKAEFLESKSPSIEFQQFMETVINLSLKAVDIPYSFYSENFTNFSGQRQAWIQYDLSARDKRDDNRDLLDDLTAWRLRMAIDDGELDDFDVELQPWNWVSVGVPWINPLQEVNADVTAIGAGLTSRTRRLREQGQDFDEVAEELAYEQQRLGELGLPTSVSPSNAQIVEITANAA